MAVLPVYAVSSLIHTLHKVCTAGGLFSAVQYRQRNILHIALYLALLGLFEQLIGVLAERCRFLSLLSVKGLSLFGNMQPIFRAKLVGIILLWDKDGGRTYKHFVQSFAPGEKIDPAQAHQIACQLAASRPEWQDFEVLIATHEDKEHIHTHFVVNSVSYVDGHKLQQSKAELQAMKGRSEGLNGTYGHQRVSMALSPSFNIDRSGVLSCVGVNIGMTYDQFKGYTSIAW